MASLRLLAWPELVNHFDGADNVVVEFANFLCRNPVLSAFSAACFMRLVATDVGREDSEAKDIANVTRVCVFRVPVSRNGDGVILRQHWVENRLPRQARREALPPGITNEIEFLLPNRPEQCYRLLNDHGSSSAIAARRALMRKAFAFS